MVKVVLLSIVLSISVKCYCKNEHKEYSDFLIIEGCKISVGEKNTDKDGFLEIFLNYEKTDEEGKIPYSYSAILTVRYSEAPIYIEQERGDVFTIMGGKIKFKFVIQTPPVSLYVEFGNLLQSQDNKWYHFDLVNGKCALLEEGCPYKALSVFDKNKWKNTADIINSDIRKFKPKTPQPMLYIIYANPVINPLTKEKSTGGRTSNDRYLPISTEDLFNDNGNLFGTGGLVLTDDPNQATFVLILYFYYRQTGTFNYSDNTRIWQYNADNHFVLYNMISGQSITKEYTTYATYAGEPVSVTSSSKGKQMFAGTARKDDGFIKFFEAKELPKYVEFVSKSQTITNSRSRPVGTSMKVVPKGRRIKR